MSNLKTTTKSQLLEKVEEILDEKKITFKYLAKNLGIKESALIDELNATTFAAMQRILLIEQIAKILNVDMARFTAKSLQNDIEEKVRLLLRKKGISFIELSRRIGYSNAGLHRTFSNKTIGIAVLENIAKELGVDISFFFEDIIIEKLVDEILKRPENPDLKTFMFGFSRDIAKGMKLEEAVYKNMAPESHNKGLMV